ncbi:hypothetical protein I3760_15G158900 [Carya illinoinensis]|nr:hypothetical protein I3760_15G158900 [Carya illinoinensis]
MCVCVYILCVCAFMCRNEDSERIEAIVQQVSLISLENYRSYLYVAKHPVGLIHCEQWPIHHVEDHVKNLRLTSIGANDVRMVGIFGYGGVGKTTLAKAIYNSIAFQFEASCFLENIRRTSNQEYGLAQLQKTLLSKIFGDGRSLRVDNIDIGINMIKRSLHSKRVLLILDDVDHAAQLEVLAGHRDWFGKGSRIIITTRDKEFVIRSRVDFIYEMIAFNHDVAVQLFPCNALQREITFDGFRKFVEQMIMIDKGDPLVSTVFCSDFYGRSESMWIQALDQDKKITFNNIYSGFQTIWDRLSGNEKNIFLDIACFFIGDVFDDVIKILDNFGFSPNIWIPRLMEKCLIYKCDERLQMHDRFRDMGRDIVRQESPQNPGARSRLFFHKDVREVLEKDTVSQIEISFS